MPEGIPDQSLAIAPMLISNREHRLGTSAHSLIEYRIGIRHIHIEGAARAVQSLRRPVGIGNDRILLGQKEQRIPDPHLRMHDLSLRSGRAENLLRSESLFVEL